MIGRLRGLLVEIDLTQVIIDVGGVGYDVSIPMSTYDQLPGLNKEVTLLIYTNVREDAIVLYGFFSKEEKMLFQLLTTVSGVGPKSALNVLSCMPVSRFCQSVVNSDIKSLQGINGVGKKTAERIIVELRDKLSKYTMLPVSSMSKQSVSPAINDATIALEQLGFKKDSIQKIIPQILQTISEEQQTGENIIRQALAILNARK